jgi:hypothetical protein
VYALSRELISCSEPVSCIPPVRPPPKNILDVAALLTPIDRRATVTLPFTSRPFPITISATRAKMHRASLVLSLLGLVFMPSAFAYHPHSHHTHPDISTRDDAFPTLTHPDLDPSFHPRHPRHHVRVKQTHLCGGAGDAYTGYVDVEARHLFFYFIKSDEDWKKKDVILVRPGHHSEVEPTLISQSGRMEGLDILRRRGCSRS